MPDQYTPKTSLVSTFRWMQLARVLDEKLASLYRGSKIVGGVYLGFGQEALSASIGVHLNPGDVFAPLIRDQAGRLAFGEPLIDVLRTFLGSRLGPMRGRDGNIHRGVPANGQLAMISHLGAMVSTVSGVLLADRLLGKTGTVGVSTIGDGGTSTGAFHEGLNMAAVEKLPLVVVIANNQYAYSTPNSQQFHCNNLVDRAAGYGIKGHVADGTDLRSCLSVVGEAIHLARNGDGPQLVVAKLLRLGGHGEHDDASYVDPSLRSQPSGRDCLQVATNLLVEEQLATPDEILAWRAEAIRQVETALYFAQQEPAPDPDTEDWCALSTRSFAEGLTNEPEQETFQSILPSR